jgi:predicted enzyme related to lactoylglutathione lyase
MRRVVHFEIYTDDPEAVQPFYQDVFGWTFKKFEGGPVEYWLLRQGTTRMLESMAGCSVHVKGKVPAR